MEKVKHKVLALKYRPKNFKELIGQDIMVETITNSIKLNKLPNAYLLTGIRGVGKTTTARLIAKALNCNKNFLNEKIALINGRILILCIGHGRLYQFSDYWRDCFMDERQLIQRIRDIAIPNQICHQTRFSWSDGHVLNFCFGIHRTNLPNKSSTPDRLLHGT